MDIFVTMLGQASELVKLYLASLDKIGFSGSSPDLYEFVLYVIEFNEGINVDGLTYKHVTALDKDIAAMFNIYYTIRLCLYNLDTVVRMFKIYKIDESKTGTTTSSVSSISITSKYITEMNMQLDSIITIVDNIKNQVAILDLEVALTKELTADATKLVEVSNAVYSSYIDDDNGVFVIDLYFAILHKLYELYVDKPGSKPIIGMINEKTSELKNKILDTDEYQLRVSKFLMKNFVETSIQQLVVTYRLIPIDPDYKNDIDGILKLLGIKSSSGTISAKLTKAAKVASNGIHVGFVVVNKISPQPRYHNIAGLINKTYIADNGLMQPSINGINLKTIERTNTIRPVILEKKHADDGVLVINDSHTGGTTDVYYVLQSLDGEHYSIMHPWGFDSKTLHIPSGLLHLIGKNNTFDYQGKLAKYNAIINAEIIRHVHEPFIEKRYALPDEVKKEDAYWTSVRQQMKNMLLPMYKEYLQGYKTLGIATIRSMLTNNKLLGVQIQKISTMALEELMGGISNEPSKVALFKAELAVTYVKEHRDILRSYKRKMEDMFEEHKDAIEKTLSRGTHIAQINNAVQKLGETVVEDHLKYFINRRSGIFIILQNAINILQMTLYLRQ